MFKRGILAFSLQLLLQLCRADEGIAILQYCNTARTRETIGGAYFAMLHDNSQTVVGLVGSRA